MRIGIPKEIKPYEYRVGMIPASVRELVARGHQVVVETIAGMGIGATDEEYIQAGATVLHDTKEVYDFAELIVKVKEPQLNECLYLTPNKIIFTFLHLAADLAITRALLETGATAIAYETVTDSHNRLPLLAPMSEVAGRIAIQSGASCLEKAHGGKGVLLAGVPGVLPAKVVVLGGGVVGLNAIKIAIGMGASVTVLDKSLMRLAELDYLFPQGLYTQFATQQAVEDIVGQADLVIGAILVPGAAAPKIVSSKAVASMQQGSVIVDVAIDQGGCFDTSRPTSFANPTYVEHGVVHKCVTNLPGSVPRTSTYALNNATLPFIIQIADKGLKQACIDNIHLKAGINVMNSKITHPAVAIATQNQYFSLDQELH
jgi:alanine dehydrogenase